MAKHVRQLTATDMIFISAEQRGKPITSEDLKDSDILHDLVREEKLLHNDETEFFNCKNYCRSKGYPSCVCNSD